MNVSTSQLCYRYICGGVAVVAAKKSKEGRYEWALQNFSTLFTLIF